MTIMSAKFHDNGFPTTGYVLGRGQDSLLTWEGHELSGLHVVGSGINGRPCAP